MMNHLASARYRIRKLPRSLDELVESGVIAKVGQNNLNAPVGEIQNPQRALHVILATEVCSGQSRHHGCEPLKLKNRGMQPGLRSSCARKIDTSGMEFSFS